MNCCSFSKQSKFNRTIISNDISIFLNSVYIYISLIHEISHDLVPVYVVRREKINNELWMLHAPTCFVAK